MADPLKQTLAGTPAQKHRANPRQVRNNAGGYTFTASNIARLQRFLTLGVTGTYYVGEATIAHDNADVVLEFARTDPTTLVEQIKQVSLQGRAPRHNPALFALAAAASIADEDGRRLALAAVPHVVRTGTHLFQFVGYARQFRGWGRGMARAVRDWYLDKTVEDLAYQLAKYRQREGWTHRDLLRLSHPLTAEPARRALFDWVCGRDAPLAGLCAVEGLTRARTAPPADIPGLVREFRLSWEMLPDRCLTDRDVWEALLEVGLPQTALMRQLPRLTQLGLLDFGSPHLDPLCRQLTDPDRLRRARLHPMSLLVALRTYSSGLSVRGNGAWTPAPVVVDALDAAFYTAYGTIEPSDRRHLLALDVSGSMTASIAGMPLSAREASAALALITASIEPAHHIVGFTGRSPSRPALTQLNISPRQRLDDAIRAISGLPFGTTDCAQPMIYATDHNIEVDVFTVYTDNETYFGDIHPYQALQRYRRLVNPTAKLVVVGMTATEFTIAEPTDPGMLDVAGFDTAVPGVISDFGRR